MNHTAPSPRHLHTAAFVAAALACGVSVGPATASTNRVSGVIQLVNGPPIQTYHLDSFNQTSASSLSDTAVYGFTDPMQIAITGQVDARAGFGSVGLSGSSSYEATQPNGNYHTVQSAGSATATFTDVLVTGPGSGSVSTRLRLHLSGIVSTDSSLGTVGSAGVSFGITVNGNSVGFGNLSRTSTNGGTGQTSANGLFADFDGTDVVTTNSFLAPLNTALTVELQISTKLESTMGNPSGGAASAGAFFYQSLSFATDQPVFDLPAGYTANSPDGGIVNNTYAPELPGDYNNDGTVDAADYVVWRKTGINGSAGYDTWRTNFGQPGGSGSGANATAAVPEPAAFLLLMFGVAGWCLRGRRCAYEIPETH